jgi:hypothetical protein
MGENQEHRQRIKTWMAICLIVTALAIDLVEALLEWLGIGLVINLTTTPAVTLLFWLWFKMLDVPFIASPKKFFTLFVTSFGELIPALDALGGFLWTLGTIIIVIMVRAEDKGGIIGSLSGAAMGIIKESRRTGQFHRVSGEELTAVASGRGEEYYKNKQALSRVQPFDKNQNALDLRNKNAQSKEPASSSNKKQQQKQEPFNQSSGIEQEINTLKSNIDGWQNEIQRLEQQILEKENRLNEHERSNREFIQTLRESGRDEARLRELEEHSRQATMPLFNETGPDPKFLTPILYN